MGTNADRGQTTLDFAIGVGLFLLVVAFVVAFVPGIFEPFERTDDGTQVADRIATTLATDVLGDPAEPYVLDADCTVEFFDGTDGSTDCRFDTDADGPSEVFALDASTGLNVTVSERGGGVVALDGTTLAAGDAVPEGRSVTTARRAVHVNETTYRLFVRVW
ncbi:hypothetical protein SAMN04488063_1267 [Halopelagius inordinatus]|uniref:Uncharacterized protein n=1 Tax=Halopelagius inordinatus TaxID=553467 RepID=A0A1I2NNH2_9EURY|nr:hypothetical protein [Halopelagius inordinatus]SFG05113.1 hypothetical protein SAMN04488063_1267 [Halopelagius inordinatus]